MTDTAHIIVAAAFSLAVIAASASAIASAGASTSPPLRYECLGNCSSFSRSRVDAAIGMFGGAMSSSAANADDIRSYLALLSAARFGDVVVLTADSLCTNDDWHLYGPFFIKLGARSARSLCFADRRGAFDARVVEALTGASLVFVTGGDQSRYYRFWRASPVVDIVNRRTRARELVFGGESAGLAIQGRALFAALDADVVVTSAFALRAPANATAVSMRDDLLRLPLAPLVADTHFRRRDRMGRLLAFVAVTKRDFGVSTGVGINEHTALIVNVTRLGDDDDVDSAVVDGGARPRHRCLVIGQGPVNIVVLSQPAQVLREGAPLTAFPYRAWSLADGDVAFMSEHAVSFERDATPYALNVRDGVISVVGNNGSVY